ncbi:hypothetical protein [Candidatus Spongiihabitans sp.]|uniref:hypothetical protein n=1 Tax=Candidatus Spongiihabitans sp. TaxID=3101308 RepID=UPI003C6FCAF5
MNLIENDAKATNSAYKAIQNAQVGCERLGAIRQHVEEIYSLTKDVLDKKFREQIKHDFHSCYAEMYVAAVLRDRYGFNVSHPSDEGPDLFLEDSNCWIEVVSVTDGSPDKLNSVSELIPCKGQKNPENKVILRLSSVFWKKSKKMMCDRRKGIVDSSAPIIICISGGAMTERIPIVPIGGLPPIVRAVLPISGAYLLINRKTNVGSIEYKYSESVNKKSPTGNVSINTDYFLTDEHSHISAVVYSSANAGDPLSRDKWGCDFIKICNPKATNPLPRDFFKCDEEYSVSVTTDGFTIKEVSKQKSES